MNKFLMSIDQANENDVISTSAPCESLADHIIVKAGSAQGTYNVAWYNYSSVESAWNVLVSYDGDTADYLYCYDFATDFVDPNWVNIPELNVWYERDETASAENGKWSKCKNGTHKHIGK